MLTTNIGITYSFHVADMEEMQHKKECPQPQYNPNKQKTLLHATFWQRPRGGSIVHEDRKLQWKVRQELKQGGSNGNV